MARNRITFDMNPFEDMIDRLNSLGANLQDVVTECLEESTKLVTPKIDKAMSKHKRTGRTEESIIQRSDVKWEGKVASVNVGFKFPEGLASVFLMYGTPRMKKDSKLYNSIYGNKTKKEIKAKQEEILAKEIHRRMGG